MAFLGRVLGGLAAPLIGPLLNTGIDLIGGTLGSIVPGSRGVIGGLGNLAKGVLGGVLGTSSDY